ncbi:beta-2-microglobulin-like [Stigmatopora argus]
MKARIYWMVGILFLLESSVSKESSPIVQVYTETAGFLGKNNILLCHVSNFQPPVIQVDLLRNGVTIQTANQSEMVFEVDWEYYLTKYVAFVPQKGESYACSVTHGGISRTFAWEAEM